MTTPTHDALDAPDSSRIAAHGTAWRLASYAVSLLVSVVSIRLLTTHLGGDFGTFTVVSSIAFVAVASTDGGLTALGLREGANITRTERVDLLANVLGLRLVLCTIGMVAGAVFALLTNRGHAFSLGVFIVGFGLMVAMIQGSVAINLQLDLRIPAVATLELLKTIALTATYGGLVIAGASLEGFYFAPAVAGLVMLAATVPLVPRAALHPRFDRQVWARMTRSVLPYSLAAAIAILYFRVTQIAMTYIATPAETTEYAFAFRIVEVLGVIPGLVASSALPLLSRASVRGRERFRTFSRSLSATAVLAGLTLATATAAGAPLAIRAIGGSESSTSVDVLRVLAIALAFTFPLMIWSFLLISIERYRALAASGSIAAVAALALAVALVPSHGAIGGALATVGGEVILAGSLCITLSRYDRRLIPSLPQFLRPLAATIVPVTVVLGTLRSGILAPLVAIPGFAIAALMVRAVPPEVVDIARRRRA